MVSEQQAEAAVKTLKSMIDAAENSNQAGEDAVVCAAAGPALLSALRGILWMASEWFEYTGSSAMNDDEYQLALDHAKRAIAKATGA